jgi:hypothetical protein
MRLRKDFIYQSRRKTPWDEMEQKTPMQDFLHHHYQAYYMERHPNLKEAGEAALINSYKPENCTYCASPSFQKWGFTKNGVQRYRCLECKQSFTPVTNTIFDGHKISISEWIEYALNIFRYVSINADSWNNRNAFTTSRYWLEKLFLVLEFYQQSIKLTGTVWYDETFYTVRSEDIVRTETGGKLQGLSANQMCIGVACDKSHALCIFQGYGKPTQKGTYENFKDSIEAGATFIHDMDNAHKKLIDKLKLNSVAYDSRELKKLADKDNPLDRVNRVHFYLKTFLYAHRSFDRSKIQGFLNLFSFVMNPPENHLEKVEKIMDLAFQIPKSLRYRDFYAPNPTITPTPCK